MIIQEDISKGERIREYNLYGMQNGKWQELGKGTCIGHKRIEVIKNGMFLAIKLEIIKSEGMPQIKSMKCY